MSNPDSAEGKNGASISDLSGLGQVVNSELAKKVYEDAGQPVLKEAGGLATDLMKTFRLFTAPIQLASAFQDRFKAFCDRVRAKVPEDEQCEAPPEIARPVMDAFNSTSDNGPLMEMFEELMAKAINKKRTNETSPEFPAIIKNLSPYEAIVLKDLSAQDHIVDFILHSQTVTIHKHLFSSAKLEQYGGLNIHLTVMLRLKEKGLVTGLENQPIPNGLYTHIPPQNGFVVCRTVYRLTMFGKWFADICIPKQSSKASNGPSTVNNPKPA